MRPITVLTGITALLIAGCAAFFSVTGLGLLFSGATVAVVIMASALEIGKLVAASYLHNYWKETSVAIKTYLIVGIVALMGITSAGIFGFLSNAYTQTQISVAQVDAETQLIEDQINNAIADIPRWEGRIQTLSDNRTRQEIRYDELVAGDNWVNAKKTTDLIEESDSEIKSLNNRILESRAKADSLDKVLFDVREKNVDVSREIGGFRFVASAFDQDVDTIVKWFILILIFVFDPFAVMMVIAFNTALTTDIKNLAIRNHVDDSEPELFKVIDRGDARTDDVPLIDDVEKHQQPHPPKYPTHYEVDTSGGRVIIKAKYFNPAIHKKPIPKYIHVYDETSS
jgi:hypothetical protein